MILLIFIPLSAFLGRCRARGYFDRLGPVTSSQLSLTGSSSRIRQILDDHWSHARRPPAIPDRPASPRPHRHRPGRPRRARSGRSGTGWTTGANMASAMTKCRRTGRTRPPPPWRFRRCSRHSDGDPVDFGSDLGCYARDWESVSLDICRAMAAQGGKARYASRLPSTGPRPGWPDRPARAVCPGRARPDIRRWRGCPRPRDRHASAPGLDPGRRHAAADLGAY